MKSKIMFYNFIFAVMIVLLAGTGIVFAFYRAATQPTGTLNFTCVEGTYYDVADEYSLCMVSDEKYYNDINDTAEVSARKSIRLTQGIKLTKNLLITSDVNLNLGGLTEAIDLNGYTLTFRNMHYGSILISDGGIIDTSPVKGWFKIHTPNAAVIKSSLTIQSDINKDEFFSKDALINCIFEYTDKYFEGFYHRDVLVEGVNVTHYYTYTDLELIGSFYNCGITLTWSSANESVISNSGKVTPQESDTAVLLTLTLSGGELLKEGGGEITVPFEKTYTAAVITNTFDRLTAGVSEISDYLEYYKFGSGSYYIYGDVNLPRANAYYALSYTYTAVNNVGSYITDLDGYTLKRDFVQRAITLTARVTNLIDSSFCDTVFTINAVVKNNYETANQIADEIGLLIVEGEETVLSLPPIETLQPQGVESVTYTFINNNSNYQITNNTITVINLPSITDVIYLNINLGFIAGTPVNVDRQLRIYYVDASLGGGGEDLDPYAYYYAYLTDLLLEKTGGKTFEPFTMPSEHLNHTIGYNITSPSAGLVRVAQGESISLGYYQGEIYCKVIELITDITGTRFEIYFENLQPTDFTVNVSYLFDYTEGEKVYYKKTNTFLINGIIHKTQNGIPDLALYGGVLGEYDANNDDVLTTDEAMAEKSIFALNTPVADFKGINYLTGTLGFNLDGTGFNGGAMQYLGSLTKITSLSLKNNGLTDADLSSFAGMRRLLSLDLSDNSITNLNNLPLYTAVTEFKIKNNSLINITGIGKFLKLNYLDISGNNIKEFRDLLDVKTLREGGSVYIYNNTAAAGYGSMGQYNLTVFVLMYNSGINLYREQNVNLEPVLFTLPPSSPEAKGTAVLESIIYSNYSQTQIILPGRIYSNDSPYYEINWDCSALTPLTPEPDPVTGIITLTHSSAAGSYTIYASVEVSGVTVYRPFYIEVPA